VIKFTEPLVTESMLQLNHNTGSNVIAILPNVTGSYSGSIQVEFKYDYLMDNVSQWATASVISNNNYLICDITGSQIPTASGFYSVNFITGSETIVQERAFVSGSNNTAFDIYTSGSNIIYVYNK
jgi:hypothetical protein